MDGLLINKITKKRVKIPFIYGVQCINKPTSNLEIPVYLHAADVNYHHDCWLSVTIKDILAAYEKL